MFKMSKKVMKKALAVATMVALILTTLLIPMSVSAYGPSTLYTPPSGTPAPGALYGRAMQASNGKMYATFEQYTSGTPVFPIYESTDNGSSWTQVGTVSDTHKGYGMRYQPFLYQLPQAIGSLAAGTLLCAGNCIPSDLSSTEIDLYKSTDSGRTWSYVSTVATGGKANPDGTQDPVWEPFLMVANNKLICYYSDERDTAHNQKIVHETSTDGVNWGSVVNDVALSDSTQRPGMPIIAKMSNGSYIMTYEIVGVGGSYYQTSTNPEVWSPTSTGTKFGGTGSPYCAVLNGTVVLSCNANDNLYTNNNNASGSWTQVSSVLGTGYTRCIIPLSNGRLFEICGGSIGASTNTVKYADMALNYKFINVADGQAVDNMGSTVAGANICQYTSGTSYNQQWNLINLGTGYYQIQNSTNGLYLDTMGHTGNGSIVSQYTASTSYNQQWQIVAGSGYVKIINRANGLCLDTGAVTTVGAPLQMWVSGSSTNQQWQQVAQ